MTEQAETPKILDEISKSNSAKASSRISRKQQTARRRFVVVLAILFPIIAGVLLLGYQQISVQSQLAQMTVDNQQLTQNLEQQTSLIRELEQSQLRAPEPIEFDDSALLELESTLIQEVNRLTTQLADLQAQQLRSTNETDREWKILEAE